MSVRVKRGLVLVVALASLGGLLALGLWDLVRDSDRLEELLTGSGVWGPLVFVALMGTVQPFGLPGVVFIVPASLVWPTWLATLAVWGGGMVASTIGFYGARFVARDLVESRLSPRVLRYDRHLAERGLRTVIVLRLATNLLPQADWLLGMSRVRSRHFFVGTAIGLLPGIVFAVVAGAELLPWALDRPPWVWAVAAGTGTTLLLLVRRRRARLGAGAPLGPTAPGPSTASMAPSPSTSPSID
ncbi:MAG: VTT domain-containing protein [Acidimicrobiia bacterium]|nr:VTT domain-containing protein [Acidimicrobiia bacterium]